VDSQKFDICGSRHSGSVSEPESRVLKHAKIERDAIRVALPPVEDHLTDSRFWTCKFQDLFQRHSLPDCIPNGITPHRIVDAGECYGLRLIHQLLHVPSLRAIGFSSSPSILSCQVSGEISATPSYEEVATAQIAWGVRLSGFRFHRCSPIRLRPSFTIFKGEQFAGKGYFFSTGYWLITHSSQPPLSTSTCLKPALASCCATRALVASWGQAQYKTIFLSLEYLPIHSLASSGDCRCAPCIFHWLESQSWSVRTSTTTTSGFVRSSFN